MGSSVRAERSSGRMQVGPPHLLLALMACVGLFAAGFLLGRAGDDGGDDDGAAVESTAPNAPATEVDGGAQSTAAEPGEVEGVAVTVEALEAGLAEIDITTVSFTPRTDELTDSAEETLGRVAQVLIDHPFIPVEIETSTFTEPTAGENHGLSVLQAQAIAAYLIDGGVEGDRLAVVGLGSPLETGFGQQTILLFDSEDEALAAGLVRLDALAFELGEDDAISGAGQTMLAQMSRLLEAHPDADVRLIGYASAGSESESHDRSHLVVDRAARYLADLGIDRSRLETIGMGSSTMRLDVATVVELEVGFPAAATIAMNQVDTERLTFSTGTPDLTEAGLEVIAALAQAMSIDPESSAAISVHTYTEADSRQNHDLSHRQGDAIVAALVELGVAADRVVVFGHGDPPQFAQPGRDTYVGIYPLD